MKRKPAECSKCGSKAVMYYEDCMVMDLQFCASCKKQSEADSLFEKHVFFSCTPKFS